MGISVSLRPPCYSVSSRTAKAIQRKPVSEREKERKEERQRKKEIKEGRQKEREGGRGRQAGWGSCPAGSSC